MFGRSGYGSENDEGFYCQCGDWTSYDESITCGCCEEIACEDCVSMECDICKENQDRHPDKFFDASVCDNCVAYPGCKACDHDVTICKGCIKEHLSTCSKQNRAERIISSEMHSIEITEKKIDKLRNEIASKQSVLRDLELYLVASKERKLEAEADAELEGENNEKPSNKQRSTLGAESVIEQRDK